MPRNHRAVPGGPRLPFVLACAWVIALLLPATLLFARQDESGSSDTTVQEQLDAAPAAEAGDATPETDTSAAGGDAEAPPVVRGEPGIPAADPGPIILPTPTLALTPTPQPTATRTLTPTATATPNNLTMKIDLDVYSGRPNPSWETTPEEAQKLVATLRSLPDRELVTLPDSLGYRGMVLQGPAVQALGYDRITIRRGIVVAQGPRGGKAWWDRERELESQAAATAEGRVDLTQFADLLPSPTPVPRLPQPPSRPFNRDERY